MIRLWRKLKVRRILKKWLEWMMPPDEQTISYIKKKMKEAGDNGRRDTLIFSEHISKRIQKILELSGCKIVMYRPNCYMLSW